MAEYFTSISFGLAVPADHHSWFQEYIEKRADSDMCEEPDEYIDFNITYSPEHVAFSSEDGTVCLAGLTTMLHRYLKEMNPDAVIQFQIAYTCSRPRWDAYGGGACVITAKSVYLEGTGDWIARQLKRVNQKRTTKYRDLTILS